MKTDITNDKHLCEKFVKETINHTALDLSNVSPELHVARTRHEFEKIWAFRKQEYSLLLPEITGFENDPYDRFSIVLFTEDSVGNVTSTGRLAFDTAIGLPEERLVHTLIKEHRQTGLKLAEYGRVIIRDDTRSGLIKHYFKSAYSIAADNGIDSIIVVSKRKDVGFYLKMVGANLLSSDVNETFGGKEPYACIEWNISKTTSRFLKWCGVSK